MANELDGDKHGQSRGFDSGPAGLDETRQGHFVHVPCQHACKRPMHNEMAYNSLIAMLMTENLYFVASWTLPNGKHSNNMLIFPVQNVGLVGVLCSLTGIPEMPQELLDKLDNNPNLTPRVPGSDEPASWPQL
ncbi:hypothetical protein B0H10DRAFT_2019702 [Mycena sp. CBHHK59/15]|nr:hypothetical protein B0H10DRAFT_2019702 [Mycena sp. CBHHK59/15]